MSLQEGLNIVDEALMLSINDLVQRGMPKDEAEIALIIRLRHLVSPDIIKVADLLSEDDDVASAINTDVEQNQQAISNY
jgi:hypothetical protein